MKSPIKAPDRTPSTRSDGQPETVVGSIQFSPANPEAMGIEEWVKQAAKQAGAQEKRCCGPCKWWPVQGERWRFCTFTPVLPDAFITCAMEPHGSKADDYPLCLCWERRP